jgi:colanic acid/amylovoran biosynthesis glycosyltransferase
VKVLYLVNTYPSISQTFIRREIHALERRGVVIERVSIRPPEPGLVDPADREEARRTAVLLRRGVFGLLPDVVWTLLRRPSRFCRALRAALRLARGSETGVARHLAYFGEACVVARKAERLGAEHVHAHFATNPPTVALLAQLVGGPGFSFTVHNLDDAAHGRRLKIAEKVAAARFTVVVSEYGQRQVHELCDPAHRERIHLVRCGLDSAFLDGDASPPSLGPDLLFVGRLCPEKHPILLIEAAARLAAEGVPFRLRIVGSGELERQVRARIHSAGLADRCVMTGALDGAGVRRELEACRALVLPSRSEGLPLVLMEALARRRPVITTAVAGIPELVRHGEEGWLVPSDDVEALKGAMLEALRASPQELLRRGNCGAERVRARHRTEDSAELLLDLFRRSIGAS